MRWEALTLGELCEKYNGKIQTGPFGSQLHQSDYRETGTPVVMPKDIINDRISTADIARIEGKDVERLSKHILNRGDIVFPRRGEINKRALVTEESEGYICGTGCLKISINSNHISNQFLNYYLARKESVDWLENNAVGSTMKNLSGQILSNLPITLPPLPTQRRIASILSAYDDLIENNLKRIKLLEEAAQNIYREWFVHFRYPGHERVRRGADGLPEGWRRVPLGEAMQLNYGKSLTQESRNSNGPYPVYGSSGIVGYHDEYLVEGIGIILGRKGNVGTTFLSFKNFYPIDTVYYVVSDLSVWYAYLLLSNESFVSSDAAVPGLNRNYAYSKMTTVPTNSILKEFDLLAEPIFQQINLLNESNGRLKEARDILLPRLMNQTIEV